MNFNLTAIAALAVTTKGERHAAVVVFVVVLKAGNYCDHDSNICAKMSSNSILLNKLPSM